MSAEAYYGGQRPQEVCARGTINMFFIYILKCADGKPYTGCTSNLKDRMMRHNSGYVDATKSKLPIELQSYFAFNDEKIAFRFEKYLKSGSGRAFAKKHFLEQ